MLVSGANATEYLNSRHDSPVIHAKDQDARVLGNDALFVYCMNDVALCVINSYTK